MLWAIRDRCAGPLGRKLALDLSFAQTRDEARTWLSQSAEATRTLQEGRPVPLIESEGIQEAIERVRVGGVLAPVELRALGRMLEGARTLRRFLTSRKVELPTLFAACATDPSLDAVADHLAGAFEPDGTLADRASDRLRDLRGQWHAARQRMVARMEDLMKKHEAVLQDRFVTEREGRWVLPVRSDAHERFPGIVHSTSSSGATLFVEPRAVIAIGNRLKVLEGDVKREEEAICARLTERVVDALPSVEAAREALALADVRVASARLALDLKLTFPALVDEPRLDLKSARHPLLALDFLANGGAVVPSDLCIEAGRAMVISGPNAGGKTVALKTMGLAALMVRCGVPVACAQDSHVGLFDVVLTDVGDDQSLQKNLSTFSAHVQNVAAVLGETTRGALVLLDELAGGTDPREGEALAAGILDSLCARGGAVAVATHYEGLKALALVDPRFTNASVGFDLATMMPTFELAMGLPGRSSALAVARRFGLPATVIERAERFLARGDHNFETLVQKLHDERAALALARGAAEDREREAMQARATLEAELQRAQSRERKALSREARDLVERLQRARDDLREAQARLRSKKADAQSVREAERAVERAAGEFAIGGPLEPLVNPAPAIERELVPAIELRKGARVWVQRLRAEADVIDVLGEGNVRVAAGPLKLTVPSSELRVAAVVQSTARAASARETTGFDQGARPPIQVRDNTCDLRGLRTDDALAMAQSFLDRALGAGQDVVFLLHGHGSGALREAVRKELSRTPCVAQFRSGGPDGGGEGVTVVWLA